MRLVLFPPSPLEISHPTMVVQSWIGRPPLCHLTSPSSLPLQPLPSRSRFTGQEQELIQSNVLHHLPQRWSETTSPVTLEDFGVPSHSNLPLVFKPSEVSIPTIGGLTLAWLASILRQHWWTSWDLILAHPHWSKWRRSY